MRTRRVATVLVSGALAAGSFAASTPAAHAAGHPESLTFISTYFEPVTSSTGQHLVMSLSASRFSTNSSHPDTNSPGTVSITLSKPAHIESHTWSFPLSGGSFSTDKVGTGTITTGDQLGSFGAFTLKLKGGASHQHSCDAANFQVIHRVKLKGKLSFDTHSGSTGWGKVSSKGVVFRHGTLIGSHGDDAEEACAKPLSCVTGVTWTASHHDVTLSGSAASGKNKGALLADRFVELSSPNGATRSDDVTLKHQPLQLGKGKKPTLQIGSAGKHADGASNITAHNHAPYAQTCKGGEEKGTTYTGLYNIADVGLTVKAAIFGPIELSTVHNASFTKVHVA